MLAWLSKLLHIFKCAAQRFTHCGHVHSSGRRPLFSADRGSSAACHSVGKTPLVPKPNLSRVSHTVDGLGCSLRRQRWTRSLATGLARLRPHSAGLGGRRKNSLASFIVSC